MAKICLVGDTKSQRKGRALAELLFTSNLFKHSRAYAERHSDRWYILSAKHGLLKPTDLIDPYSLSIRDHRPDDRFLLAQRILQTFLRERITTNDTITMLANTHYCEVLVPVFEGRGFTSIRPFQNKNAVEQIQWLKSQTKE